MMGWNISVYRQSDGGDSPATIESKAAIRLAVWQAKPWGLEWLDNLASAGTAINLGGNGYPSHFTGRAEHLLPFLEDPPYVNSVWSRSEGDIVLDGWVGKTLIDQAAMQQCRPGEWLLVEIWDES